MKNFELYYPVRPRNVNQGFGNVMPVYTNMGLKGHNGIDFAAQHGQPIYASHDGRAYYEIDGLSGHGVVLRSNDTFNYEGVPMYFKTIYWHFCDSVKEPQFKSPIEGYPDGVQVEAGDLLGYADNTGESTGDHLHYGLKPMLQNEPPGTWYNFEQNNGYLGSIDPMPFFNGLFAEDLKHDHFQFTRDLTMGSAGADVLKLQQLLNKWGYGSFTPTGYFWTKTRDAVTVLQKTLGVTPTVGYFGQKTRAVVNKII